MTDQPQSNRPQAPATGYHPGSASRKIERPVSVSLLAFSGILVGSLLLFCNVIVMVIETHILRNPAESPMKGYPPLDPMVVKIGVLNAVGVAVFAAVLLGASLAALSLHRLARPILLVWSIGFILIGVGRTIGEIKYVGPANVAYVERNQPENADLRSGRMAAMVVPKAVGFLALYCTLPVLFLLLWTRRDVKEAFERGK